MVTLIQFRFCASTNTFSACKLQNILLHRRHDDELEFEANFLGSCYLQNISASNSLHPNFPHCIHLKELIVQLYTPPAETMNVLK